MQLWHEEKNEISKIRTEVTMLTTVRNVSVSALFVLITACSALAQPVHHDSTFYKQKEIWGVKQTILTMDFSAIDRPTSVDSFVSVFHFPPIRQDTTGTCWAFSTTSFLESELKRLGRGEVKLSEMFTVYHEYLEKARRFVREKGNSAFGEGSEANAVIERIKQYGIVRESDYSGLLPGQIKHNHRAMVKEMKDYLDFVKEHGYWDEDQVLTNVRMILNRYMGEPPKTITVNGKSVTPREFAQNILKLPLDDYVALMSFRYIPFYTKGEYTVVDNWWHSKDYYNVPLDEFYGAIKNAIQSGYSVALGGDVSEPGKSPEDDIAIIPDFDIADKDITQDAREFRFYNKTSTDDHGIHLVGFQHRAGHDWFLIKDSGSSAYEGRAKGYYFFRDDYVKLKMLTALVHKDAVKELLAKFK